MSHDFLDFIEDMLDAMNKAEILVEGVAFDQFVLDWRPPGRPIHDFLSQLQATTEPQVVTHQKE